MTIFGGINLDLTVGKSYGLSLKELYKNGISRTEQGYEIRETKEGRKRFYDLINSLGECACCDGESCVYVQQTKNGDFIFKNTNNGLYYFRLSPDEVNIAVFK